MPRYKWEGKTNDGSIKNGIIEAASIEEAQAKLRSMDITPTSIKKAAKEIKISLPRLRKGVKLSNLMVFTRQLSTMIDAGLPLVQALDILGSQEPDEYFKSVILGVKESVESGSTLAAALGKYPQVFDSLYVNLVAAGEVGGILDTILNRLATYLEKSKEIRSKIKKAMTYPIVVLVIVGLVLIVMITMVIPKFASIFKSIGGRELPALTQMVINISKHGVTYLPVILGFFILLYIAIKLARRNPKARLFLDGLLLKVPVMGNLIRQIAIARFARTLSTLIASGVPILDALDVVSKAAGNAVIENGILRAKLRVSEGKPLADSLAVSNLLPEMVIQMIAAGESTGAMDVMLEKVADFYEDEVDAAVEAMTSVIEPVLIVVLGGVVGFVLVAMYLPLFKMADNLARK